MEELKNIKDILVEEVQSQMHNLRGVNAKELGEVIDMIKDISETMYYCSVVKAMDEGKNYYEDGQSSLFNRGYSSMNNNTHSEGNGMLNYGSSSRRMYMENKKNGQNNVQELETYMQELTQDLSDMIQTATPEEKQILQRKVNALAAKLQNV